jgi:hypothetical protein
MVSTKRMLDPAPDSARAVCSDAFAAMDEDEQEFLRWTAYCIMQVFMRQPETVSTFFDAQRLDEEEKLAIWSLLPSYVRSAIKRKI